MYRLDSICRDIARLEYDAIIPSRAVDCLTEAHRLVNEFVQHRQDRPTRENVHFDFVRPSVLTTSQLVLWWCLTILFWQNHFHFCGVGCLYLVNDHYCF